MGLLGQLLVTLGVVGSFGFFFRRRLLKQWADHHAAIEQLVVTGTLAAGAIHEAKNPLNGIVGFAQLGQSSSDVKEMREYFALIEQDAMRANAVLEGMLDFTRPTQEAHFEPVAVNEVIESALRLVRHQLMVEHVVLETALAQLPALQGDANQLRQVLINVLLNAAHAVAEAPAKKVVVRSEHGAGAVKVIIEDSGPGLTEEAMRRVFTPFFTTKPRGQGTGLGLSVSRRLIEAHGGSIRIESATGQGARVTVVLPVIRS